MNGIELGSIIEVENEDQSGYWFASVCSSTGVLIRYLLTFEYIKKRWSRHPTMVGKRMLLNFLHGRSVKITVLFFSNMYLQYIIN